MPDIPAVRLHGSLGDVEVFGHFLIGFSARQGAQYGDFLFAQDIERRIAMSVDVAEDLSIMSRIETPPRRKAFKNGGKLIHRAILFKERLNVQ
jgi:hypothetical protein